jgi:hypothetical protein
MPLLTNNNTNQSKNTNEQKLQYHTTYTLNYSNTQLQSIYTKMNIDDDTYTLFFTDEQGITEIRTYDSNHILIS